jgi:hypothetical protein
VARLLEELPCPQEAQEVSKAAVWAWEPGLLNQDRRRSEGEALSRWACWIWPTACIGKERIEARVTFLKMKMPASNRRQEKYPHNQTMRITKKRGEEGPKDAEGAG